MPIKERTRRAVAAFHSVARLPERRDTPKGRTDESRFRSTSLRGSSSRPPSRSSHSSLSPRRRRRRQHNRQRRQESRRRRAAKFDASPCLGCHAPVKALYDSGKHKGVGCNTCHDGTAAHLADSSKRPSTKTDLANCGGCHQNQYQTYAQMDWHRTARFEKKQTTGPAPDPAYDLLMSPHGFTRSTTCRAGTRSRCSTSTSSTARSAAASARRSPGATWRAPATSRSGTSRSISTPTTPTRRCSSRARRRRRIPCACRARRRTTSSNGRTWATPCPTRSGAARRRSSSSPSR